MDLIEFVVAREQREQGQDFKVNAADSPVVHLMIVVAISQEALRRSVPPRADILCKWRLRVDATAWPKIGQLHLVFFQKDVFTTEWVYAQLQLLRQNEVSLTVWCLCGKCRFGACGRLLSELGTCSIWLFIRASSVYGPWWPHTCSYPWVQKLEQGVPLVHR